MHATLPPWPDHIPRLMRPIARLPHDLRSADAIALDHAYRVHRRMEAVRCSFITGVPAEMFFANRADFSALASSSTEASILAGTNLQPVIPAGFFGPASFTKTISIVAKGVLSTTSTPTMIFQVRLGTTAGAAYLSGTSVAVSPTITTASSVSNQYWELRMDLTCYTPGIGTNNTTLSGAGYIMSPGGFASPFAYAIEPTTPPTATWTATIDSALTQYLNISQTWGSSSSSNTMTCKSLQVFGWN